MRYYHYILIFIVLIVVIRISYIIYVIKKQLKIISKKEGFESLSNCLMQGYPTRFCKRVPLEACVTNCQ